ncbi:protein kinase domain containing protein [Stylonychia lemnae]|uniref:non-specific serine/threonine protein kinase n=1 Tax=Stylonychia lemnae TaxID=5949 RepID=A0A078AUQ9_STYLE|nr:protein kinase domain containing protein [Stylonychia lemnae]|eukprot:CDW84618.1 protein kinase domain containing protein [Stylonychia lemnae]
MVQFLNKYTPLRVLAEGSYGKVILAKRIHEKEGELVAIKIFNFKDDEKNHQSRSRRTGNQRSNISGTELSKMTPDSLKRHGMIRHFQNEVVFLAGISHPYIVKVIETASLVHMANPFNCLQGQQQTQQSQSQQFIEERKNVRQIKEEPNQTGLYSYLVMEYAERGNLFDYICQSPLSENATCFYFRQLLEAMVHLKRSKICHRDLKPENLLIDNNYDLKLADFGFATHAQGINGNFMHFTCKGTLGYMAPEILNLQICENIGYNAEQTDVFAMGVILFSLIMGRPPFWKADPMEDKHFKILNLQQYQYFWNVWETQYSSQLGIVIREELKNLFNSLVSSVPCYRLTLNEICNHPWVRGYKVDEELAKKEMHHLWVQMKLREQQQGNLSSKAKDSQQQYQQDQIRQSFVEQEQIDQNSQMTIDNQNQQPQSIVYDPLNPNGYVQSDPKNILIELEQYALKNNMKCKYKKNSHKIDFLLPLSDGVNLVEFEVVFEKGKKKKDQGLYKLRFKFGDENVEKLTANDVEFLTSGFLQLIQGFAAMAGNNLYSLEDEIL